MKAARALIKQEKLEREKLIARLNGKKGYFRYLLVLFDLTKLMAY
jgi:hypothetical protein